MQSALSGTASCSGLVHRPACAPFLGRGSLRRPAQVLFPQPLSAASSSAAFDDGQAQQPREDGANQEYKPFSRRKEGDPYKLLGVSEESDFEEVVDARNYLVELYKWHEESRESVELAFDSIIQQKYKGRFRDGFRPPRRGGKRVIAARPPRQSPFSQLTDMFDSSISLIGLINEGIGFAVMALWALYSVDQSFPLAGAFAFSVFKYQAKRVKANPEGPYFGGTAIIGAILTSIMVMGLAYTATAAVAVPLAKLVGMSQLTAVSSCVTVFMVGLLAVYMK